MAKWIPCGTDFIVGDVLRWREPAWRPKELGRRSKVIGEHQVVAQVQSEGDNGFVRLVVKQCVTKRAEYWLYEVPPLPVGTEINRRREPMAKRGLERYQWGGTDGEAVRGMLTSKFAKAVEDGKP